MKRYKYIENTDTFIPIELNDIKRGDVLLLYSKYQREPSRWFLVAVTTDRMDEYNQMSFTYREINEEE